MYIDGFLIPVRDADKETGQLKDSGYLAMTYSRNTPGFAPIAVRTNMATGWFWDEKQYEALNRYDEEINWHDNG